MASITLNPIFISLHGRFGKIVFYSRWKQEYCRVYRKPSNPETAAQQHNRSLFADAMRSWQALDPEQKQLYNKRAHRLPMTGHNLYISEYMKRKINNSKYSACLQPGYTFGSHSNQLRCSSVYSGRLLRFAC